MSYYDIDAIITTQNKLPCTFKLTVPGLGYLEASDTPDLKADTKLDLPYWMAELLAIREVVDLHEPACYGKKIAAALKADPRSVDLRSQCNNFYTFALRYLEWTETDELLQVVLDTFRSRIAKMADHAHNPTGAMAEGLEFLKGLDDFERQLFKSCHDCTVAMKKWVDRPRDKEMR